MSRIIKVFAVAVACATAASALSAQAPAAPSSHQPSKTPWGDPDLQGIWPSTDMVGVPFERPKQFGNRLFLTDAEFKTRQDAAAKQSALDVLEFDLEKPPDEVVALGDVGGVTSPPPHWLERGEPSRQSSLIVEPINGQMPAMTPEGLARQKGSGGTYTKQTGWNNASELSAYDRCISRGPVGSMMPVVYNNGNEIIQAPGFVAFRNEMIHETRVIPLDERPLPPSMFKSYMGYSRGHFEGNTLVLETTNFRSDDGTVYQGANAETYQITERFTRVADDTINYEFTINDPATWTKPWTAVIPWTKIDPQEQMYEYMCHEDNFDIVHLLTGARAREKNPSLNLTKPQTQR